MRRSFKIFVRVMLVVVLAAFLLVLLCPQIAATHYGYFDLSNGQVKHESVSFGRIYQQSIESNEYSELLEKLQFQKFPPDWRLATQEEWGFQTLFSTRFVDYSMGSIEVNARMLALGVEVYEIDQPKARELVKQFQNLARRGDLQAIRELVNHMGPPRP